MLLKRNLLTSLYSLVFILLMGLGFFQVSYLALIHAPNRNLIGCILILGIIIFLILAYFVRSKGILNFFQKNNILLMIVESILGICVVGGIFYLNMDKGVDDACMIALMLLCIYLCSRLLAGRLCGILSLVCGFFFVLNISTSFYEAQQYINVLCFLIPYVFYLACTKVFLKEFSDNAFMTICLILILSITFSIAMVINPVVCFLLIGCVFQLLFGKPEKGTLKIQSGPMIAGMLTLVTAILFLGITYLLFGSLSLFNVAIDETFLQASSLEEYSNFILDKYLQTNSSVFQIFTMWLFPSILMFFAVIAGYFSMMKKESSVGALCLSFIGTWIYYMLFGQIGSHFYYLTYFLPIFAAYGITYTLIKQNTKEELQDSEVAELPAADEPKEETTAIVEEEAEPAEPESIKEKEKVIDKDIPEWIAPQNYHITPIEHEDEVTTKEDTLITKDNVALVEPASIEIVSNESENDLEQFIENDSTENTTEIELDTNSDDNQLNTLLERLDITDNIRRMNEIAQEDIADVIEKEDTFDEVITELPTHEDVNVVADEEGNLFTEEETNMSHSTLPKYVKPEFDFKIEPVSQPLEDSYSQISEYDRVPTISDLEHKWRDVNENQEEEIELESPEDTDMAALTEESLNLDTYPETNSGFAYSLDDLAENSEEHITELNEESEPVATSVHSEEVIKKSGIGKRSYHKITIR